MFKGLKIEKKNLITDLSEHNNILNQQILEKLNFEREVLEKDFLNLQNKSHQQILI